MSQKETVLMDAVNGSEIRVRVKTNPFDLAMWRLLEILTRSVLNS